MHFPYNHIDNHSISHSGHSKENVPPVKKASGGATLAQISQFSSIFLDHKNL